MNVLLWLCQIVAAFLYVMGGGFKTFNPDDVRKQIPALPRAAWQAVGVFEVVGGLLLVVPAAVGWRPELTPLAATALTLETVILASVYASYSLKMAPTNPLVFAVPMALLAAFIAYGRYYLSPLGG